MFSEIAEIKSIREQKKRLSEREAELTEPILTDLGMIGQLWEWFKEIVNNRDCPGRVDSVTQRKKFILIVLFLYSPSTLAGGKMKIGLRDEIAEVIGCSGSLISHNYEDVMLHYQLYKPFRADVDQVFSEMVRKVRPI